MAKKHKHVAAVSGGALRARVQRAQAEGRFQSALDLAKQLHRQEPTPEHRDLLRQVYLGRARQLRAQGHSRDAITVLETAQRLEGAPLAWQEQVAAELARSGAVAAALAQLDRLGETPGASRVRALIADAAVDGPTASRAALPEAMRADLDAVLTAFAKLEAGDDEGARMALQALGLRSSFLEWKLLLRGLQAYWTSDDARALENWQRLDAERLPAQLAAPYRFAIDPAFRAAQPPATQAVLQRRLDVLQGSVLLPQLRSLRAEMENKRSLAQAFRLAEGLLPALKQQAPHLVPRLASCMYWAAIITGPDDVLRYRRVFGAPDDDPQFHRLYSLAYEQVGNDEDAHEHWQKFQKDIAAQPLIWQGHADRARALIWLRMGKNAVEAEKPREVMGNFLFGPGEMPGTHLRPGAEECFQKSYALAPDMLAPYQELLRYHLDKDHAAKAEKAARRLLQKFPDHGPTLEALARLRKQQGDTAEGLRLLQQALHASPLDRDLRRRVASAHLDHARTLIQAADLGAAAREIEASEPLLDGAADRLDPVCVKASLAFKAKDTDGAEALLAEAIAAGALPEAVSYLMLVESVRGKLPPAVKKRFDGKLKAALEPPPRGAVAARLLELSARLDAEGVAYFGQKTHNKKLRDYADKAAKAKLPEAEAEALGQVLLAVKAFRSLNHLARDCQQRFPRNPWFPYLEAAAWLHQEDRGLAILRARPLLQTAERLARALPESPTVRELLSRIEEEKREADRRDVFGAAMDRFFGMGGPFGGPDDDDEFDDYDDE